MIYSQNRYQSYDLDFVTYEDRGKIKSALEELDFVQKGRYFHHPDSIFFIEFVTPPVSVGKETIKKYNHLGAIILLSATDCVKDRLASFYYWNDRQALEQATMVCKAQKNVNLTEIKKWSILEGQQRKYEEFLQYLANQ